MPKLMSNHGNYIVSMANVCRWLAQRGRGARRRDLPRHGRERARSTAPASELRGVVAGEFGLDKDRRPGPNYEPGMELLGKYVLIAEGVRGVARQAADRPLRPRRRPRAAEVRPRHEGDLGGSPRGPPPGPGHPHDGLAAGQERRRRVVHLPPREQPGLRRLRRPPELPQPLALSLHGVPALQAPPADRASCCRAASASPTARARSPRAAGSRCRSSPSRAARCSAARPASSTCRGSRATTTRCSRASPPPRRRTPRSSPAGRATSSPPTPRRSQNGPIARDLKPVRNVKPLWSRYGLTASLALGGLDMWSNTLFGNRSPFGTLKHGKTDAAATGLAADFAPIDYPKPDGVLSFDRLTNVAFSFTNHAEDQPCHLVLRDPTVPIEVNLPRFAEPAQRYCPAGVYEVLRDADGSNPTLPDQLPELRPLQDLRHQGSAAEHRLDDAAGRRRAELSEHVTGARPPGRFARLNRGRGRHRVARFNGRESRYVLSNLAPLARRIALAALLATASSPATLAAASSLSGSYLAGMQADFRDDYTDAAALFRSGAGARPGQPRPAGQRRGRQGGDRRRRRRPAAGRPAGGGRPGRTRWRRWCGSATRSRPATSCRRTRSSRSRASS